MAPEVNLRRLSSQDFIKLDRIRRERNIDWEQMEWDQLPMIGQFKPRLGTDIRITNDRNAAWRELVAAQRNTEDEFCDVHLVADDGHIKVHSVFLTKLSAFLERVIKEGYMPCREDVVSIKLAGVTVKHLKAAVSILYGGVGIISAGEEHHIKSIFEMLQITNVNYDSKPCDSRIKGVRVRCYRENVNVKKSRSHVTSVPSTSSSVSVPPPVEQPQTDKLSAALPVYEKVTAGSMYKKNPDKRIKRSLDDKANLIDSNSQQGSRSPPVVLEGENLDDEGGEPSILPEEFVKLGPSANIKFHQQPRIQRQARETSADRSSQNSDESPIDVEGDDLDSHVPPGTQRYEHDAEYVPSPGDDILEEEEIIEVTSSSDEDERDTRRPETRHRVSSRNRSTSDERSRDPKRLRRSDSANADSVRNKSVDGRAEGEEEIAAPPAAAHDGSWPPPEAPRTRQLRKTVRGDKRGCSENPPTSNEPSHFTAKNNRNRSDSLVATHKCALCGYFTPIIAELEAHLENSCARHLTGLYDLKKKYCKVCVYFFPEYSCLEIMNHIQMCACSVKPKPARKTSGPSTSTCKSAYNVAAGSTDPSTSATAAQGQASDPPFGTSVGSVARKKGSSFDGVLLTTNAWITLDRLIDENIAQLINEVQLGKTLNITLPKLQKGQRYAFKRKGETEIAQPVELNESSLPSTLTTIPDVILQQPPSSVDHPLTRKNPGTMKRKKPKGPKRRRKGRGGVKRKKVSPTTSSPTNRKRESSKTNAIVEHDNIEEAQPETPVSNETSNIEASATEPPPSSTRNVDTVEARTEAIEIVEHVVATSNDNEKLRPETTASAEILNVGTSTTECFRTPLLPVRDVNNDETQNHPIHTIHGIIVNRERNRLKEKLASSLQKIRTKDKEDCVFTSGKDESTSSSSKATSSAAVAPESCAPVNPVFAANNAETSKSINNVRQNDSTEQSGHTSGLMTHGKTLEVDVNVTGQDPTTRKERISVERQSSPEDLPAVRSIQPNNDKSVIETEERSTSGSPADSLINPSASVASLPASASAPIPTISITPPRISPSYQKEINNRRTQVVASTYTPPTGISSEAFKQSQVPVILQSWSITPPRPSASQTLSNPRQFPPSNVCSVEFSNATRHPRPDLSVTSVSEERATSPAQAPKQGTNTNSTNVTASGALSITRVQSNNQGQLMPTILSHSNLKPSSRQQKQQANNMNAPAMGSVLHHETPMLISSYLQRPTIRAPPTPYQTPRLTLPPSQSQTLTSQSYHANTLQGAGTVPSIASMPMAHQSMNSHNVANLAYQNQQGQHIPTVSGGQSQPFVHNHANAPLQYRPASQQVQHSQNARGSQDSITNRSGNLGQFAYNPSTGTAANSNRSPNYQPMEAAVANANTQASRNQNSVATGRLSVTANVSPLGGSRAMQSSIQVPIGKSPYQNQQQQQQARMLAMQGVQQQTPSINPIELALGQQNNHLAITNNNTVFIIQDSPSLARFQQNNLRITSVVGNFVGGQVGTPVLPTSQSDLAPKNRFRCPSCSLLFSSENSLREHEEEGLCD